MKSKLKFSKGNAKLSKNIYTFSLPAGWSCPGANICKSKTHLIDGVRTVKDGKACQFRCYAASQEALFENVHLARQHNFSLLRGKRVKAATDIIQHSLPSSAKIIRLHVSGDFFSQSYFDAWLRVARNNPNMLFYTYTKSLPFWVNRLGQIPRNFILTASRGGKHDKLIDKHNLRCATVVYSEEEAERFGLPIDHDDSHAMKQGSSFALLLHGVQPKNSEASKALAKLKKAGKGGYGPKQKVGV